MADEQTTTPNGTSESLLDLTTTPETPFITVDGTRYHYKSFERVPLIVKQRFAAKSLWLQGLGEELRAADFTEEWDDEKGATIEAKLNDMLLAVLENADELLSVLSDDQKMAVISRFFPQAKEAPEVSPTTISETQSPDSDVTTAEVSKAG